MRPTIQTRRNARKREHPNTVFSYLPLESKKVAPPEDNADSSGNGINDYYLPTQGSFSFAPNEHLLIITGEGPSTSGSNNKIAKYMDGTSPPSTNADDLTISSHSRHLGDSNSSYYAGVNVVDGLLPSSVTYFDRENETGITSEWGVAGDTLAIRNITLQKDVAPFVPSDADIGTIAVDNLGIRANPHGAIRIIKWAEGKAPPLSVITSALYFMANEWKEENFVLYEPLFNYVS